MELSDKESVSGLSPTVLGVISLFSVLFILGLVYQRARLAAIGVPYQVRVTEVEERVSQLGLEYLVKIEGSDEVYEVRADLKAGDITTLLYSDRLELGVLLPGGRTFFHILYHTTYLSHLVFILILMVLLLFYVGARIFRLGSYIYGVVRDRQRQHFTGEVSLVRKLTGASEFLVDSALALVLVLTFFLIGYAASKAMLYVEQSGVLQSGIVLLGFGAIFFSDVPERAIRLAFRIREDKVWPNVRKIVSNVLATITLCFVAIKMVRFLLVTDFRSMESIWEMGRDFLLFLIG